MSNIIRCDACNGSKKVMGMGMMNHTCHYCKGVGSLKESAPIKEDLIVVEESSTVDAPVKKKPGPKPKE